MWVFLFPSIILHPKVISAGSVEAKPGRDKREHSHSLISTNPTVPINKHAPIHLSDIHPSSTNKEYS